MRCLRQNLVSELVLTTLIFTGFWVKEVKMLSKQDGPTKANLKDPCWIKNRNPNCNGWYDIAVERTKRIGDEIKTVHEVALDLFRDGNWTGESHGTFLAWREPKKFDDDINKPAECLDTDAVISMTTVLVSNFRSDFNETFRALITAKNPNRYNEKINNYLYANRCMSSQIVLCAAGGAQQKDIVITLCNKELRQQGVPGKYVNATRKAIHAVIKNYKEQKRSIPKGGDISKVYTQAFVRIKACIRLAKSSLPEKYENADEGAIIEYFLGKR